MHVNSVAANSEREEHVGINASFENASRNNNILHVSNVNDETRQNIPDEVSELSVSKTHFDLQAHTHHKCNIKNIADKIRRKLIQLLQNILQEWCVFRRNFTRFKHVLQDLARVCQ